MNRSGGVVQLKLEIVNQILRDLYITSNWDHAKAILDRYKIHYIFVGFLEKNTYPVSINKFEENLERIFNNSEVTIYQYSPRS